MSEESIEQEPVPEHWETQLQERVESLYAKRAAPLAAEVERLQAGLDESCARLLEQARARVAPEEVAGLRAEVGQWLAASAEAAEREPVHVAEDRDEGLVGREPAPSRRW